MEKENYEKIMFHNGMWSIRWTDGSITYMAGDYNQLQEFVKEMKEKENLGVESFQPL